MNTNIDLEEGLPKDFIFALLLDYGSCLQVYVRAQSWPNLNRNSCQKILFFLIHDSEN